MHRLVERAVEKIDRATDLPAPWTNVYGAARSLIAMATLSTLLATETGHLFAPMRGAEDPSLYPLCGGAGRYTLFCLLRSWPELSRWLAIAILLVVASGWRPRWTGLPHWWVSSSVVYAISLPDGGDHVAAVLTLLLLPLTMLDPRRSHWSSPPEESTVPRASRLVAHSSRIVIRIQVAIIYLHAAVGKLRVTEWADGTAIYYWLTDPYFGAPRWLEPVVDPLISSPLFVTSLTYGSIGLEFALFGALFLRPSARWVLLGAGLAFHALIALCIGIPSFSVTMIAALLLYLCRWDRPFRFRFRKSPTTKPNRRPQPCSSTR